MNDENGGIGHRGFFLDYTTYTETRVFHPLRVSKISRAVSAKPDTSGESKLRLALLVSPRRIIRTLSILRAIHRQQPAEAAEPIITSLGMSYPVGCSWMRTKENANDAERIGSISRPDNWHSSR